MLSEDEDPKIEVEIRSYIAENLLYSESGFPYKDDTSFLGEGIIDSLGVMELVDFVQQTFSLVINQSEVTPENFDSVARLSAFVRLKLGIADSS